jgi:hypothetical protein
VKNSPFLHLRGGNINSVCLTAATHREIDIEGRQIVAKITFGDNVEGSRVVKDVIVQREFTAEYHRTSAEKTRSDRSMRAYLGMKSTPRAFMLVQLVFLTSAAALVRSSEEILPAQ